MNIGFCEDMTHEFKSDRERLPGQEIIDAVVAFANTEGEELCLGGLFRISMKQMHQATLHEFAQVLKWEESRLKAVVEMLVESGLVEAIGTGRGRRYMLSPKAYEKEHTAVYVRQKGIAALRHEELVLELAKTQRSVRRADVIALLHVSPAKAF